MDRILIHIHRRWKLYLPLFILLTALAVWSALRARFEQDILKLIMPEGMSSGIDRILRKNPLFESFYVDAWGADRETLKAFAGAVAAEVRKEKLASPSDLRMEGQQVARTMRLLFERRFYLTGLAPSTVSGRLPAKEIERQIEIGRAALLSLTAPVEKEQVARDPAGLFGFVEDRLKLAAGRYAIGREGECLFSKDGKHCLVSFHPGADPSDFSASAVLVGGMKSMMKKLSSAGEFRNVRTLLMGPHLFSAEGGRVVKTDVNIAFVVSTLLVLALFLLFFRGVRPLLVSVLVLGVSLATGIGLAGLATGKLHGITYGFASILMGITIDYVIHVSMACRPARADGGGFERKAAEVAAIFPSLLGGWFTTAIIFVLLAVNRFPLVRQMGIVGAVGITAAFVTSLLLIPNIPAGKGRGAAAGAAQFDRLTGFLVRSRKISVPMTILAMLLMVASTYRASRLAVESDVEKLDYRSPQLRSDFDDFQRRWSMMGRGDLVIAKGRSIEEALRFNDRIYEKMKEGLDRGAVASFMSVSPLMPSIETQRQSLSAVLALEPAIEKALAGAEEKYGLRRDFFSPFFEELEKSRSGLIRPLRPSDAGGTFIERILKSSAAREGGAWYIITSFVPSGGREKMLSKLPQAGENIIWWNSRTFLGRIFRILIEEVTSTFLLSAAFVLIFLLIYCRSIKMALLSAAPLILSIPVTAGVFSISGQPINAIGLLAFCLVVGLGIDYGIFMVSALRRKADAGKVASAVLLSALTTIIAFGVLAFCRSPVLSAVGMVVGLGITFDVLAALLLIPALYGIIIPEGKR